MSDNLFLEIKVAAHDEASPVIKRIVREIEKFQRNISKTFANPLGNLDAGLSRIKAAQAEQRAEIDRTARAAVASITRQASAEKRLAGQRDREAASARRSEARDYADGLRNLRSKFAFESRMSRQRDRETAQSARQSAAAEAEATRAIQSRMRFAGAMLRQRVAEEKAATRELAQVERERAREARDSARLDARRHREKDRADRGHDRERGRDRDTFTRRARDAGHRVSDAYTRSTRFAAGAGAAGAVGTGALVKRGLGAEVDVDSAEISTRIYGGLSKDQARDLRDRWAAPLSEQLGVETAKLLTAWVDATKLGIPSSGARDFAALTTKTSEAWEVSFDKVKDTFGTVNSILTSDGSSFNIKRLSSVSNTLQHLAAKQSMTPEKLIEFLNQGAGASQILGASQEAGLAFGSASTSLGNKAGESGRLYDYIASRVVEMPRLTRKKGDDGKYSKQLMRDLGYGTAENMDSIRRANPDGFLPNFMDRFAKIKEPKKQEESIRWFTGREWMGEFGRMVKGAETYREAEKLRQEAKGLDAIGEVWETHKEKLSFVFKQFRAGWLNVLGEFGKELSPLARQAGDFFLGWTKELRSGSLAARFKAAIQGAIEGLGFKDLPAMLSGIFGEPGDGGAGSVESWKAAAFGFADGVRSVGAAIKQVFSTFAGATASPEAIARLTGQIVALAGACVVIAPVVGVIGSLATALGALALAATSAWRVIRGAGVAGAVGAAGAGAGASATAGAAAGGLAARLGLAGAGTAMMSALGLAIVAEIGANRGTIATVILDGIKAFVSGLVDDIKKKLTFKNIASEFVPAPIERWLNQSEQKRDISPEGTKKVIEDLNGEIQRLNETLRKSKETISGSSGDNRLKGSEGEDRLTGEVRRLVQNTTTRLQLSALSATGAAGAIAAGGGSVGGAPGAGAGAGVPGVGGILNARPGQRLGPTTLGRRGIIGGASGMPDPGTGSGTGPYKGLLDHIARSEGTAHRPGGGYNTSLDYGRWLPGGQEQNLTGLTLDQIDALQTGMLSNPDNRRKYGGGLGSSAMGRYQIVRKTLRGLRQKLGLKGDAKFDEALQDRLAAELARQRGANGSLGQEWASLRGGKLAEAVDLARQIPRGASTVPGARPGIKSGDVVGATGSGSGSDPAAVGDRIRGLMRSGALSNAQCVALAKSYVGVTGSVTGWRRGEAADAGTLKPGTPVATFLNRDGSQSDKYDGGVGVGKEGNKTTHAGIFAGYVYKDGKIVGMNVVEQYRGSGGPRTKTYTFNNGRFGTDNGSNYHAVMENGGYLGGKNNPMAQVGEAATKAADTTKEAAKSAAGTLAERFGSIPKIGDLVNRMNPDRAKELVGQGLLSEGFRKHKLDDALGGRKDLLQNLPFRSSPEDLSGGVRDQAVAKGAAQRALMEGGAGGKSMTVSAPITIQGVTSPEAVANRAARHIQDSTLWRTHDTDFQSA